MPTYIIKSVQSALIEREYIVEANSEDEAMDLWSEITSDDANDTTVIDNGIEQAESIVEYEEEKFDSDADFFED